MDSKIVDILIEYIEILIHNILYVNNIYPKSIFERRVKYDLPVRYLVHTEVNDYITNCLLNIRQLLLSETLYRVNVVFYKQSYITKVFSFNINYNFETKSAAADPYMIKLEQSLRSHFLKMINSYSKSESASETTSFKIFMHTDELSAINLQKLPHLEDFPIIESENDKEPQNQAVVPISSLNVENILIQTYITIQDNKNEDLADIEDTNVM